MMDSSNEVFEFDWERRVEHLVQDIEDAEFALAYSGGLQAREQRKNSGSFYTPADVAYHFWELFFRAHSISDAESLRQFIRRWQFVEPSAGSGIFVFSFLRKALAMGLAPAELAEVRFHVIDINLKALRFFKEKLVELEQIVGSKFENIGPDQIDFLEWVNRTSLERVAFVGNPPYVANSTGSRWRNAFADFVEAMLQYRSKEKAISLILPISICFSRDYLSLRSLVSQSGMGLSASNYDNIPDCLFKSGKPETANTNRANSQRCTILNLGGPDPSRREATALLRWSAAERRGLLSSIPKFQDFAQWQFDGQFPRPENTGILEYLSRTQDAATIQSLTSGASAAVFGVGGVARNYIGLRDAEDPNSVKIRPHSDDDMLVLIQVLSSQLFFDYWKTVGDGFHVTSDLIERFPIESDFYDFCYRNRHQARAAWSQRRYFAKEKLNSGKLVRSYDFTKSFSPWQFAPLDSDEPVREIA